MSDYPPPQAGDEEPTAPAEAGAGPADTAVPTVPAVPATGDDGLRMLLQTAVACRPLEEVADLVTLLRRSGQVPDAANEALRAAAVSRPVEDVVSLALLLSNEEEAVVAPRPDRIEDGIGATRRAPRATRAEKAGRRRSARPAGAPGRGLRWPAVAVLALSALLYLPRHPSRLLSEGGAGSWVLLGVAALCAALGVCLVVRDRTRVWAAAAAAGLGILAVHALAAMTGLSPLSGAVGGLLPWPTGLAVLLAALGAALAGMALLYRSEEPTTDLSAPEPVVHPAVLALDVVLPYEDADTAEAGTTTA
ncbi:hypothetical protein ABZ934_11695 [Streptomyces sp. NPDC046557]|uniref:hypothetical protein n=1 Tax=Streptomyces sp. NPDC046557 TaxID=3155372 RepID=UPI003405C2BA